MVKFKARFNCCVAMIMRLVLMVPVFAVVASTSSAAPIYNMDSLLNQTNPFLQPLPPLPPEQLLKPQPVTNPARTTIQPARPSAGQPVSGSGSMKLPQSFEQRTGQGRGATDIQWQKRSVDPKSDQMKSTPYKSDSFLSEIRVGALYHDQGPFSSNKEGGVDANLELLFASPDFFDILWSPRPHMGLSYNSSGDTSQAYLGLTWEWDFLEDFFAGFSLGGMVHDGFKTTQRLDRKELGCRILFRESITFGYRFSKHHSLMAFLDHSSNAKLCSRNEGLENVGIRYGYRF